MTIDLLMTYEFIPLLPLVSFLILGLFGHWIKDKAHLVAVPAVVVSWLLSLLVFFDVAGGHQTSFPLYTWLTSGMLDIHIGFSIDRLTAVMLLLVTTVSSLVHIYTIGYMHGDPGYARFFSYIALFTFSMLMLVMADNLLQLFIFWEAVGLCSYLLIGHWYDRPAACSAATKAFIVNRVGDFGFMLGLLLVWYSFGSLDYHEMFARAHESAGDVMNVLGPFGGTWDVSVLTLICVLLFTGAVGKSAQVPLHVWLPDAMEGPTPISALIHAATMVTAGVFMVARLAPLYNLSPTAMTVVAITGGVTMVVGATIALTQTDIKRVVAYSTVSQLGYMIMACGLGAYAAGMYHLLTHGAFKALLFLGCGSVIIALHHEQDMRRMGGLKDKLPVTYWTFVVGSLALAGFPLTSGFFSKDNLLVSAWSAGPARSMLDGPGPRDGVDDGVLQLPAGLRHVLGPLACRSSSCRPRTRTFEHHDPAADNPGSAQHRHRLSGHSGVSWTDVRDRRRRRSSRGRSRHRHHGGGHGHGITRDRRRLLCLCAQPGAAGSIRSTVAVVVSSLTE